MRSVLGVAEGIENRFAGLLTRRTITGNSSENANEALSRNKIKRLIMHILLATDKKYEETNSYYLRLLGEPKGLAHIRGLPKATKDKIITSFKNTTDEIAMTELKASRLYDLLTGMTTAGQ